MRSRLIIMDEPTSALSSAEVDKLFRIPEQCVCEHDDLSHDSGDCALCGFSGGFELVVLCLEIGIESDGDERRHVERLSDIGPAAANEGAAGQLPDCRVMGARPASEAAWP